MTFYEAAIFCEPRLIVNEQLHEFSEFDSKSAVQ